MGVAAPAETAVVLEVGELYRSFSHQLEQMVRLDVHASDTVVEDACQLAWGRLLCHRGRVCREAALSWLTTTAVREARKLLRRERRCISLDVTEEPDHDLRCTSPVPGPEQLVENRERLELVRLLPERQQKLMWLQALGLSYAEIAVYSGCTLRTVERQLLRAKRALREASD